MRKVDARNVLDNGAYALILTITVPKIHMYVLQFNLFYSTLCRVQWHFFFASTRNKHVGDNTLEMKWGIYRPHISSNQNEHTKLGCEKGAEECLGSSLLLHLLHGLLLQTLLFD